MFSENLINMLEEFASNIKVSSRINCVTLIMINTRCGNWQSPLKETNNFNYFFFVFISNFVLMIINIHLIKLILDKQGARLAFFGLLSMHSSNFKMSHV